MGISNWRRKTGCVLLGMALVLGGVWAQGIIQPKSVKFQFGHRNHWLTTNNGKLIWVSADKIEGQGLLDEEREMIPAVSTPNNELKRTFDLQWPVLFLPFLSACLILVPSRNQGGSDA